jgi:hypothetical protein
MKYALIAYKPDSGNYDYGLYSSDHLVLSNVDEDFLIKKVAELLRKPCEDREAGYEITILFHDCGETFAFEVRYDANRQEVSNYNICGEWDHEKVDEITNRIANVIEKQIQEETAAALKAIVEKKKQKEAADKKAAEDKIVQEKKLLAELKAKYEKE